MGWPLRFKWESEEQRKGFLTLVKYLKDHGIGNLRNERPFGELEITAAFFIQKDHESHLWIMEMLDRIISPLQSELKLLRDKVQQLEGARDEPHADPK